MDSPTLIKAVNAVLTRLVSPKLNNMVSYQVTTDTHYDTGKLYVIVDVIVDSKNYWELYDGGYYNNGEGYDSPSDFDDDIARDVKQALKYLGIQKSVVDVLLSKD